MEFDLATIIPYGIGGVVLLVVLFSSFITVKQGTVGVMVQFGKFKRILQPGLNFKTPFIEMLSKTISIQNRSSELAFQAITADQANVTFKAMLLYAAQGSEEETIKKVAYKFNSDQEFIMAITRTIEGSVRGFVATQKQADILALRNEIVTFVKGQVDHQLADWGYHLLDLQINDIAFDKAIIDSMARVVASANLKTAAENEGQALLITKTKQAEAEGNYIKIQAEAEKQAATLRGQGVASFREEVAKGLAVSVDQLKNQTVDATSVIMFSMWTEAVKNFAEVGKGNVIFLDGSPDGMQQQLKQIMALNQPAIRSQKNGAPATTN